MMMCSKIVAGDYEGCGISYNKGYFGSIPTFEITSKPDAFGKPIGVKVSKATIESVQVGGSESDFRAGQAVFGAALFGPIGVLMGGNNRRHSVIINWKDGRKSLCDLNDQEFNALQKEMF